MVICPECDAEIKLDEYDVDKGDLLSCPECGSNLEVTGVSPIDLELVTEEDEEDDGAGSADDDFGEDEGEDEEEEEGGDWDE